MATLIENKKARFNFELMDTYEAGLDLFGFEVKAIRARHGKLEGAHITVRGNEAYLIGMSIPPYQPANTPPTYEPDRNRRLLLTKKEIGQLTGIEKQKGLTIVPISVYSKGRLLKLRIAVARGKKKYDKREGMKTRDAKRNIERTLKGA
ncbi:MAG TPA: SsrA-binding protein SmpB [Candidatus Paceibacterota bacterium]|jgi:SsrA-binding protein